MQIVNTQLIKKWEELRLEAYLPTTRDKWTIGWGHTRGVKKGDSITKEEANQLFAEDVKWVEDALDRLVKVPLNQFQYDALASLVFNIGETNFATSTLLRKLNAGDYNGAAHEFPRWIYQKKIPLQGLINRRKEEMDYFLQSAQISTPVQTVDKPDEFKSLLKSKEIIGGAATLLTGVSAVVGNLNDNAQTYLAIAVICLGAFFVVNRVLARKRAER